MSSACCSEGHDSRLQVCVDVYFFSRQLHVHKIPKNSCHLLSSSQTKTVEHAQQHWLLIVVILREQEVFARALVGDRVPTLELGFVFEGAGHRGAEMGKEARHLREAVSLVDLLPLRRRREHLRPLHAACIRRRQARPLPAPPTAHGNTEQRALVVGGEGVSRWRRARWRWRRSAVAGSTAGVRRRAARTSFTRGAPGSRPVRALVQAVRRVRNFHG